MVRPDLEEFEAGVGGDIPFDPADSSQKIGKGESWTNKLKMRTRRSFKVINTTSCGSDAWLSRRVAVLCFQSPGRSLAGDASQELSLRRLKEGSDPLSERRMEVSRKSV